MANSAFRFNLLHQDSGCSARQGEFFTPRGVVKTPTFMPVGTQGTVKGVTADQLRATGAQMILGNTYHLALRPGEEIVQRLGGLHQFMGWEGPILTDSGGFQVFSLADRARVTEDHVEFRSHIDGRLIALSPERSVEIQEALGSDVAMVFDHVVRLPAERSEVEDAMRRSLRWAKRCRDHARRDDQALFGIVQGGLDTALRCESTDELVALDFPGYAIGGLSVGEPPAEMYQTLDVVAPRLPADRPRYLMGVGRPIDMLEGIRRGVDLFDCVMPTRNGRNSMAFTDEGPLRLRNRKFAEDDRPLESDCPCPACRHSRGYLRHLFMASEMLGPTLVSIHNLTYFARLMSECRDAIAADRFEGLLAEKKAGWSALDDRDDPADAGA